MKTNTGLSRSVRCAAIIGVLLGLVAPGCSDNADNGGFLIPASIDQEVTEAGPNPASVMAQVSNRGSCALDVTTTASTADGKAWLSVSPANLAVAPDATGTITLSFEVVSTALTPGNYVGTVVLAGTCATNGQPARGSPRAIAVNLRVTPIGAAIAVDTTSVGVDVSPVADQWRPIAENPTYQGRNLHTAVWTGREMWVFGGENSSGNIVGLGGKYDPLTDQWSNMPNGGTPGKRVGHTAVWTGTEMIVWGGRNGPEDANALDTGARLGAGWTATSTTGAPSARSGHTAVWTGTEMIVWGGLDINGDTVATGGRYNPSTDTWSVLPTNNNPASRTRHAAAWTGKEMLIWGGSSAGIYRTGAARYNPATNQWTSMASGGPTRDFLVSAWTGSHWLLFGGEGDTPGFGIVTLADGAAYSPTDDVWVDIPLDTQRRSNSSASAWTGRELLVWGGGTGRRLDPLTGAWSAMSTTGQPSSRTGAVGVWTGAGMIVYGGAYQANGGIYR